MHPRTPRRPPGPAGRVWPARRFVEGPDPCTVHRREDLPASHRKIYNTHNACCCCCTAGAANTKMSEERWTLARLTKAYQAGGNFILFFFRRRGLKDLSTAHSRPCLGCKACLLTLHAHNRMALTRTLFLPHAHTHTLRMTQFHLTPFVFFCSVLLQLHYTRITAPREAAKCPRRPVRPRRRRVSRVPRRTCNCNYGLRTHWRRQIKSPPGAVIRVSSVSGASPRPGQAARQALLGRGTCRPRLGALPSPARARLAYRLGYREGLREGLAT